MGCDLFVKDAAKIIRTGHLMLGGESPAGEKIDFSSYSMRICGRPFFSISGEFHFSRYPCENWEEQILKMKACGLDTLSTYMFWNYHEFYEGQFDFEGDRDIARFCRLCHKHDMYVILRVGPYAHGECRNGGLPDWLFGRPFEVRSNDVEYLEYVSRYYNEIGSRVKDLMFTKGGPIIGIQLENEYMAACSPWEMTVTQNREWITQGTGGLEHIRHLMKAAREAGLESAFYTCTGWGGAPFADNEMLPLWGGYAYWPWLYWDQKADRGHPPTSGYLFKNQHNEKNPEGFDKKYPYACCEMGGGMQTWYPYRFVAEPESVEAMSLVTVANGCNYLGYYMFHGGLNKVIDNTTMNEQLTPRISYDFQAPLSDNGQPKESYKRLKLLHYMFRDFNDELCTMPSITPKNAEEIEPSDVSTVRFAARSDGEKGLLFVNNYQDHVEQQDKNGIRITVHTKKGSIAIPRNHTFDLKKNVSAVFPFMQELSGMMLEYATVQYITKIEGSGETAYFFFSHRSLVGEFCFLGERRLSDAHGIRHEMIDGHTFIHVPNDGLSSFSILDDEGGKVRFVCLDREQSLDFYRASVKGGDYAVITPANVYHDTDGISFEAVGIDNYPLWIYPELPRCTLSCGTMDKADDGPEGVFRRYVMHNHMPEISVTISRRYDNRALLKFDAGLLNGLSEAYVYVDYTGDIGWAFIDGRLIHDDMSNGMTWKFNIGPYRQNLKEKDLYLYISPMADDVKVEGTSTFARIAQASGKKAEFRQIRIVPEKTQTIVFDTGE